MVQPNRRNDTDEWMADIRIIEKTSNPDLNNRKVDSFLLKDDKHHRR